jgi:hypothetical protein
VRRFVTFGCSCAAFVTKRPVIICDGRGFQHSLRPLPL